MIGFAVSALMRVGLAEPLARRVAPFALAAAFVLAMAAAWLIWLSNHDATVIEQHEAKIEQRAAPARDRAADQRARDTIRLNEQERAYHDAIDNSGADTAPDAAGLALGCERLRRARVPLPAECGPDRGDRGKAEADR
ncbi:hypothetical protein [Sphingomonas sp.]|uniref:hypothetical protein n=1 Tax=Sphingomonas sp. TaxID=28214 RepID=UPI00307FCA79